jgi:hypothetical protein
MRLSQIDTFGLVPMVRRFGNQKSDFSALPKSLKRLPLAVA